MDLILTAFMVLLTLGWAILVTAAFVVIAKTADVVRPKRRRRRS